MFKKGCSLCIKSSLSLLSTDMASNGNLISTSVGISYSPPLVATTTVSQTYTVRIPLGGAGSYASRASMMVED